MTDALGYYKILQLAEDASAEDIKNAYRELAKKWHPDYNHEADTTDVFQKISIAYDILSHPQKKLEYDVLSLAYDEKNYPDLDAIQLIKNSKEERDIRAVKIYENLAWGISYKKTAQMVVANYQEAVWLHIKSAAINWLFGWWHPKMLLVNIKSLIKNFKTPVSSEESLKILLHNMVFYARAGQNDKAVQCGLLAKRLLKHPSKSLDDFISQLNSRGILPPEWNLTLIRLGQLIVPGLIVLSLCLAGGAKNFEKFDFLPFFSKEKEIDYYQKVDFGARGQGVDDVVVGKILSIPVDKSDNSKLYYLTEEAKIMYGPSDEFDVIKTLKANTTIRLTGITPDKIWARVMIDNGEIGFVRMNILKQGIGTEIPFGSSIIE